MYYYYYTFNPCLLQGSPACAGQFNTTLAYEVSEYKGVITEMYILF